MLEMLSWLRIISSLGPVLQSFAEIKALFSNLDCLMSTSDPFLNKTPTRYQNLALNNNALRKPRFLTVIQAAQMRWDT